jgi:hypothetical protein
MSKGIEKSNTNVYMSTSSYPYFVAFADIIITGDFGGAP